MSLLRDHCNQRLISSPFAFAGSMPTAYRMHYQITFSYLCHNLDGFCQGPVVHSKMLHGI